MPDLLALPLWAIAQQCRSWEGNALRRVFRRHGLRGGRNCRRHALDLRPTGIRCRLDGLERNLDFSVAPFQRHLRVRRFPQLRAKGVSDHRQRAATRPAERTCSHLLMNSSCEYGPWAPRGFSSFQTCRGGELSWGAQFPDAAVLGPVLAKLPSRSPHPL